MDALSGKQKRKKSYKEKRKVDDEDLCETLRDISADETSAGSTTGQKCTHTHAHTHATHKHTKLIQNTYANIEDKKRQKLRTIFYYGLQQSANIS